MPQCAHSAFVLSVEIISRTDSSTQTYCKHSLLPACKSTSMNRIEFSRYHSLNLEITGPEASGQLGSSASQPCRMAACQSLISWLLLLGQEGGCGAGLCPTGKRKGKAWHSKPPRTTTAAGGELQLLPANPESPRTQQGTLQRAGGQLEGHRDIPSLLGSP